MSGPAILLIVLGVILGPAYYGYCEYVSGEDLQSITVNERADRWTLPDGSIEHFRNGLAYSPVELTLRPDLNRLRISLSFDFPDQGKGPQVEYLATLLDQGYPVIVQPLQLHASGRVERRVRTFEVPHAGDYLFLLEEVGPPRAAASVTVRLRGQIEQLVRPLIWFGYGLLLAGTGVFAYSLARSTQLRR
jgi:hypothetical protein